MSPRVVLDPADHSVGMHVDLAPSPIDGLVYVVGDVDVEAGTVDLRFAFSETRRADVLPEMPGYDRQLCRAWLLEEAQRWVDIMDHARHAGYGGPEPRTGGAR